MFKYKITNQKESFYLSFDEDKSIYEVLQEAYNLGMIADPDHDQANYTVELIGVSRETLIDILSDVNNVDYKTADRVLEEYQKEAYDTYDNACLADEFTNNFEGYFEGQTNDLEVIGEDIDSICNKLLDRIGKDLMEYDTTALYELLKIIPFKYLKGYLSED
jgi:hypothetical protein